MKQINLYSNKKKTFLDDFINNKDETAQKVALAMLFTPVCAYAGSYIGEGLGYLFGNVVDLIPYAKDVAPWLAERAGLIKDSKNVVDLNENFYQTMVATSGFWSGLLFPSSVLFNISKFK